MALPVNIQFAGIGNPFTNISKMPPYVSKSIKPIFNGGFERTETQYTFNGQLTGLSFSTLKGKVDTLFSNFSSAFYTTITVDSDTCSNCQLDSISIDASNYVGIVPYTVQVTCNNTTNGTYANVKNISRELSYQETEDKQLQISHKISADGIRTAGTNDTLSNARTFVNSFKDSISDYGPYWNGISLGTPTLINQKETINPIEGNVSLEENYIVGTEAGSSPVLRYNININSGVEDGNVNVTIDGNIIGGKTYTFSDLKSRLGEISTSNLPLGLSIGSLRVNGENYDYNEDVNTLNFSRSFTTDKRIDVNGISQSFNISVDSDFIEQINKIDYKAEAKPNTNLTFATVKTSFGTIKDGLNKINNLLGETTFLNTVVDKTKLHLISDGLTIDEKNATISSSQSYDDTNSRDGNLINLDYTVKISPGLDQYAFSPILDTPDYYIENLKYKKRYVLGINGSALIDVSKIAIDSFDSSSIVTFANKIRNDYFKNSKDMILIKSNVSLNKETASCSFDIEYSAEDNSDYK
jgi:hypothetical protein